MTWQRTWLLVFLQVELIVDALVFFKVLFLIRLDKVRNIFFELGHLVGRDLAVLEHAHHSFKPADVPSRALILPLKLALPFTVCTSALGLLLAGTGVGLKQLDFSLGLLDLSTQRVDVAFEDLSSFQFRLFCWVELGSEN